MGVPTVQYTVAVAEERLMLLDRVAKMAARQERDWLAEQRREHLGLRASKLAAARRATRELLASKRESGELAGSRDWLLVPGVRAQLAARGWDQRKFKPIPAGALAAGRRWGTDPGRYSGQHDEGETKFLARLGLRLPHDLGERLARAVYWHNAKIEAQLQQWADRWGDGPEVILQQSVREHGGVTMLAALGAAFAPTPSEGELAARTKLRKEVVTTGDLIRAALDQALTEAPKRARLELSRLTRAAQAAERDAAHAERRRDEAKQAQEQAEAEHKDETAAKAADEAVRWNTQAVMSRLEGERLAAQAADVADLIEQLGTPPKTAVPEQLAFPED
ncbi:hypothetical protein ACIPLC_36040 [Kitasatospora sp. NPDC086801]|uniref:hypothetical protein n=1 Tax=Kitasatospora sp. NPDC086801 TaxID=3364066 RepID=UPI0037FBB4DA